MSNPDFSKSPEHVALAKEFASVNYEAWNGSRPDDVDAHWKEIGKRDKGVMLAMADAAMTHLGSGYVLPEATADPTVCRDGCEKPFGHFGQHSDEDAATYGEDKPSRSADYDGGPDFSAEAAERERARLTEAFMLELAGNPAVMAKMLESHEGDEVMIAAAVADMAQHLAQELIG